MSKTAHDFHAGFREVCARGSLPLACRRVNRYFAFFLQHAFRSDMWQHLKIIIIISMLVVTCTPITLAVRRSLTLNSVDFFFFFFVLLRSYEGYKPLFDFDIFIAKPQRRFFQNEPF